MILFKENNIKSITIVHMQVPCCNGVRRIVEDALDRSAKQIPVKDVTVSIRGEILGE